MNKLKLFIGVGICGVLFSGCGFFDSLFGKSELVGCVPRDMMERIEVYKQSFANDRERYKKGSAYSNVLEFENEIKNDFEIKDSEEIMSSGYARITCYGNLINTYKSVIQKEEIPKSYEEEKELFNKVWQKTKQLEKEEEEALRIFQMEQGYRVK